MAYAVTAIKKSPRSGTGRVLGHELIWKTWGLCVNHLALCRTHFVTRITRHVSQLRAWLPLRDPVLLEARCKTYINS